MTIQLYADRALSGAYMSNRKEIMRLQNDVEEGRVSIIVTEALDRLSRDQEDIARFYKITNYHNVRIFTCMEGLISKIHIGMNGTISAIQLDQMAERARRGQAGNIRAGKAAGALAYGYRIRYLNDTGHFERGLREIDPDQAEVVKRIYADFLSGQTALEISRSLNEEGIPSPRGLLWTATTLSGHYGRGNGILQNPIYRGEMIWNRNNFDRHPVTGIRHVRTNDPSEWVVHFNPKLRIVSDADWKKVQEIISERRRITGNLRSRQQYPDIGIVIICGRCGNTMNKHSPEKLICGAWKRTRTCSQNKKIDTRILCDALYAHLRANFDTVWRDWQRLAEEENTRRQYHRKTGTRNAFLNQEMLMLDDISHDVLFRAVEAAQGESIHFVQMIFKTAVIDTTDSGAITVHETTPDWNALGKL